MTSIQPRDMTRQQARSFLNQQTRARQTWRKTSHRHEMRDFSSGSMARFCRGTVKIEGVKVLCPHEDNRADTWLNRYRDYGLGLFMNRDGRKR